MLYISLFPINEQYTLESRCVNFIYYPTSTPNKTSSLGAHKKRPGRGESSAVIINLSDGRPSWNQKDKNGSVRLTRDFSSPKFKIGKLNFHTRIAQELWTTVREGMRIMGDV